MTKRITKAERAEMARRAADLRHGVRRDALRPIDAADWPEVRGKLETDLAALLRPELRSAGIERLYVLSSSEAGIVDPPSWAGIFSTDIADVFQGQLADRWRGPGAAFLLNDSILKVGRALVVAIAAHEVGHAAEYLTRGIDVAVAQPESRRLARATAFGLDQPAAIGMPFLSQHSPMWCRIVVHLAERLARLGWPIARQAVLSYRELGQFDEYREAMAGELWRLNTASLSEIIATGPHAGLNEVWVRNITAAMNVPDAAAKPKRVRRKPVPERVGR